MSSIKSEFDSKIEADMLAADPEQKEMMKEECIVVTNDDVPIGPGSKKECHVMDNIRAGMLHRAFSVFLFNTKGEVLLQKRASAKITFPDYWANTCCSHPLYREAELVEKDARGVKVAAIRKLEQELGIVAEDVPIECFTFLTKVHYSAASGPGSPWGEHEIDHVLVAVPPRDVRLRPNPNEVGETRYFAPDELLPWIEGAPKRGDLVSPWFRIIAQRLLTPWWNVVLDTRKEQAAAGRASACDANGRLLALAQPTTIHRAGDFDAVGVRPLAGAAAGTKSSIGASGERAAAGGGGHLEVGLGRSGSRGEEESKTCSPEAVEAETSS